MIPDRPTVIAFTLLITGVLCVITLVLVALEGAGFLDQARADLYAIYTGALAGVMAGLTVVVTLLILKFPALTMFFRSRVADFRNSTYSHTFDPSWSNLIFHGSLAVTSRSMTLDGYTTVLLPKTWYKDFVCLFEVNFQRFMRKYTRAEKDGKTSYSYEPYNGVGFVFRAGDFRTFYMLKLHVGDTPPAVSPNNTSKNAASCAVSMHIRLNSVWTTVASKKLETTVKVAGFTQIKCAVMERKCTLFVNMIAYEWIMPDFFSVAPDPTTDRYQYTSHPAIEHYDIKDIRFMRTHGMIGFHTAEPEHAIIKDIYIARI